jgi:hypothetical protein
MLQMLFMRGRDVERESRKVTLPASVTGSRQFFIFLSLGWAGIEVAAESRIWHLSWICANTHTHGRDSSMIIRDDGRMIGGKEVHKLQTIALKVS